MCLLSPSPSIKATLCSYNPWVMWVGDDTTWQGHSVHESAHDSACIGPKGHLNGRYSTSNKTANTALAKLTLHEGEKILYYRK